MSVGCFFYLLSRYSTYLYMELLILTFYIFNYSVLLQYLIIIIFLYLTILNTCKMHHFLKYHGIFFSEVNLLPEQQTKIKKKSNYSVTKTIMCKEFFSGMVLSY